MSQERHQIALLFPLFNMASSLPTQSLRLDAAPENIAELEGAHTCRPEPWHAARDILPVGMRM